MLEFQNNVNMFVAGAPETKAVDPVEEYHTNDKEFGKRIRERVGDQDDQKGDNRDQKHSSQESHEDAGQKRSPLFLLVDTNQLSDLLILQSGDREQLLYFMVKSRRKHRGITKTVPVSDIQKQAGNMVEQMKGTYHRHNRFFADPTGKTFTGTL